MTEVNVSYVDMYGQKCEKGTTKCSGGTGFKART